MNEQTTELIQDLQRLLQYHRTAGIDAYPATEEIGAFLEMAPPAPAAAAEKASAPAGPVSRVEPVVAKNVKRAVSLEGIDDEIRNCTACTLHQDRLVPVIGHGGEQTRLLIVGDWLAIGDPVNLPANTIFGVEQDNMLERMLGAIKINRREVYVTNLIKCGISSGLQPRAEHVLACSSFVKRQIAGLKPGLILTMGMISTRTLLNRREPLSRLRGVLHTYNCSSCGEIPLVATYHPSFLLANPDMKRATWIDLQLIARQLGLEAG